MDFFVNKQTSSTSFDNFCLASYQSSLAYESLEYNLKPSYSIFRSDPRWTEIRFALGIFEEFQRNSQELRSRLGKIEKKYHSGWSKFKHRLRHVKVADGVRVNFTELCETPFSFLAPNTCSRYQTYKDYEKIFGKIAADIDFYEKAWFTSRQFKRCQASYRFRGKFDKILSRQTLDELEASRRSFFRW